METWLHDDNFDGEGKNSSELFYVNGNDMTAKKKRTFCGEKLSIVSRWKFSVGIIK